MPIIDYTPDSLSEPTSESINDLHRRDLTLPQEVLDRHGGRFLDPSRVPLDHGEALPQSTVYRANVLLIPAEVLNSPPTLDVIRRKLATIGLELGLRDSSSAQNEVPRGTYPVALRVALGATNVDVDAWQALRALGRPLPASDETSAAETAEDARLVADISLDHLLVGSAFSGVGADIGGQPATSGHGWTDDDVFPRRGSGYARMPVTVVGGPPARRSTSALGIRRPVMVIPDTGVPREGHPWFRPVGAADAFLSIDTNIQAEIEAAVDAASTPAKPVARLEGAFEDLAPPNPLDRIVNTHLGHGIMQAGLVCQIAPDARVLMLKAMHADGMMPESALHRALDMLIARVAEVDVLGLACGYFHESPNSIISTPKLTMKIDDLRRQGVVVVAAAGNFGTGRKFWPAAYAAAPDDPALAPMLAVGARNPDGTIAIFSNAHPAVKWHAPGAAVVSTFPTDVRGGMGPAFRPGDRASLDADNFAGFAVWSGTSFAVPILGAVIMRAMTDAPAALGVLSRLERARTVVDQLMKGALPPIITPV